MKTAALLLALSTTLTGALSAADETVANGDFSKDMTGWTVFGDPARLSIAKEDGNAFLRVDTSARKQDAGLIQEFEVRPDWDYLKVSVRIRTSQLATLGADDKAWHRPLFHFLTVGSDSQPVGPDKWSKFLVSENGDWKTYTAVKTIDPATSKVRLECRILNAQGIADFDDVVIEPVLRRP